MNGYEEYPEYYVACFVACVIAVLVVCDLLKGMG